MHNKSDHAIAIAIAVHVLAVFCSDFPMRPCIFAKTKDGVAAWLRVLEYGISSCARKLDIRKIIYRQKMESAKRANDELHSELLAEKTVASVMASVATR